MVRFLYTATTPTAARQEAEQLAEQIRGMISARGLSDWGLIGPAPAFMQRSQGRWRWHLILRAPDPSSGGTLSSFLDALAPLHGWIVDVDPAHVL
jgi:primosomal protein N' (replication factor Y)